MKNLCRICAVLFFVQQASTSWAAGQQKPAEAIVGRGEIPFKLFAGFLIVMEGRIGDRDKLKFVLDTGVTHSVVHSKLAERFPGPRRLSGEVVSIDKTIKAEWVEIPDIEFGPIRVTNFSMMVGDLRYFQSFATHIDAVIGLDLLRLSSFGIDYDARKVTVGPSNTDSGIPMDVDSICITVPLVIKGKKVRVVVDTGAPELVLYEDSAAELPQLEMERETSGISMGGRVFSRRGRIPDARLDSRELEGTVFVVKRPADTGYANFDGYLGTAALKMRLSTSILKRIPCCS